jgi:hypothetical protein
VCVLFTEIEKGTLVGIESILPIDESSQTPGGVQPSVHGTLGEELGEPVEVALFFRIVSMCGFHA